MLLKRLKLGYMLYNMLHPKQLKHNKAAYKKLGLKKFYFSPVSSKDFTHLTRPGSVPATNLQSLKSLPFFQKLSPESQASLLQFDEQGYAIIKNYLSEDTVTKINTTISDLQATGGLKFKYGNKLMFAIDKSPFLREIGEQAGLLKVLGVLTGGDVTLFQSINFILGSQQRTHSDSIHMTTYPLGGLLGVWIALDDIDLTNGPLHYYPGSHKLPYYLNSDYDNAGNWLLIGDKDYSEYEKMLADKIKTHNIEKRVFTAKKGDLLIWHANLLHGGEPHLDLSKARRSMVLHYFRKNSICYHEITQRPALIK